MTAADLSPVETIEYWLDAYSDPDSGPDFMGHGMVVKLLREYAALRRAALLHQPIQPQGAASLSSTGVDAENAEGTVASSGPDGPASAALAASLPSLLLQAVEALENAKFSLRAVGFDDEAKQCTTVAAALRQRIGRE